jgi:hypothetical protein
MRRLEREADQKTRAREPDATAPCRNHPPPGQLVSVWLPVAPGAVALARLRRSGAGVANAAS